MLTVPGGLVLPFTSSPFAEPAVFIALALCDAQFPSTKTSDKLN